MASSKISELAEEYLGDLKQANRSANTITNYRADLNHFQKFCESQGVPNLVQVDAVVLRSWQADQAALAPATRARRQASCNSFFLWAIQQDYLTANPFDKLDRVQLPPAAPRGVPRDKIKAVLTAIPSNRPRDRLLFKLLAETGLRATEALTLHVEDVDLEKDDEHITVVGKGSKRRTILLDDSALVKLMRDYLKTTGYRHGYLFRAEKNGIGGPLRYQSAQELWAKYCQAAGVNDLTMHQLRHSHATELVNDGVSLTTIRKRLGHSNMQTTLRYAEQSDRTADKELREWRRRRDRK